MFKIIFVLIVVVGAITTVPPIRSRVMPPLARAMGPTGDKIALPIKRREAKTGATNLLRELAIAANANKPIPSATDFYAWAKRATNDPTGGDDPWGRRYFIRETGQTMTVGSPGPDGKRGTSDDIIVTVPWGG